MKVSDFTKNKNLAIFDFYENGRFHYIVPRLSDPDYYHFYRFFVPIEDVKNMKINVSEKASLFRRHIKDAITNNRMIKVNSEL
jgi:hypothetical protein